MGKTLKVILWICGIIVGVLLILILFSIVDWDSVLGIIFIIIGLLGQLISWLWENIDVVGFAIFFGFCIYVRKGLHELGDSITKMDQRYRDDLKEDAGRDELLDYKIKDIRERLEKLEKKSKSNKK